MWLSEVRPHIGGATCCLELHHVRCNVLSLPTLFRPRNDAFQRPSNHRQKPFQPPFRPMKICSNWLPTPLCSNPLIPPRSEAALAGRLQPTRGPLRSSKQRTQPFVDSRPRFSAPARSGTGTVALSGSHAADLFRTAMPQTAPAASPRAASAPAIGLPWEVVRDRMGDREGCGGAAARNLRKTGELKSPFSFRFRRKNGCKI